ncbi:MAG: hypothetical protein LBT50_11140 [Prevotellaceae bacterium]|jgi:hypothetical protein|nr:hypothetical protein [Prevotellaceae bacterium]
MKKILILMILAGFVFVSCIDRLLTSCIASEYYIYIDGEVGKQVEISYLGREKIKASGKDYTEDWVRIDSTYGDKNVVLHETVTLPFFKEVYTVQFSNEAPPDCYLQISSNNDSTTRAVIFVNELFVLRADGNTCYSIAGNLLGNNAIYGTENCEECTTCKGLTQDSIFYYLKKSDYPCYLEFSKGDSNKKIRLYDYWGW